MVKMSRRGPPHAWRSLGRAGKGPHLDAEWTAPPVRFWRGKSRHCRINRHLVQQTFRGPGLCHATALHTAPGRRHLPALQCRSASVGPPGSGSLLAGHTPAQRGDGGGVCGSSRRADCAPAGHHRQTGIGGVWVIWEGGMVGRRPDGQYEGCVGQGGWGGGPLCVAGPQVAAARGLQASPTLK